MIQNLYLIRKTYDLNPKAMKYVNHLKKSTPAKEKPMVSMPVVKPRKSPIKKDSKGATQDETFLFI
jgi:hypothetical protein